MAFSNTCAVKFLPLLIRLVLCAIFLPTGWHLIMNTTEFSVVEADQLLSIGVSAEGLDLQRIQSTGFGSKSSGAAQTTNSQTTAKTPPRSARGLYKVALTADHAGFPYPEAAVAAVAAVAAAAAAAACRLRRRRRRCHHHLIMASFKLKPSPPNGVAAAW